MNCVGMLSEIWLYPVKSLPGVKLNKALITKYGLAHPDCRDIKDRKWMITTETGSFQTQRQLPRMALIKLSILDDFSCLVFSFEGKKSVQVPIKPNMYEKKGCRLWGLSIEGYSYGIESEISKWLSEVLQKEKLDLVCFQEDLEPRDINEMNGVKPTLASDEYSHSTFYADLSPFMLISQESLNDLNNHLEKKITIRNFRPNFVVDNCCRPYAEDDWIEFTINKAKFFKIKECTRCLLTTVDPDTGIKDPDQQPFKTLKSYRLKEEKYGQSPIIGIQFVTDKKSNNLDISIGDKILCLD